MGNRRSRNKNIHIEGHRRKREETRLEKKRTVHHRLCTLVDSVDHYNGYRFANVD